MNRRTVVCVIVALLLVGTIARAETVEVDVTVKSVDVKSRAITVTYKTESGQKSIDLDVSRKAEITVNGEAGTLDSVKPGQKAKVTYEKELQVVTKIDATGEGTAPGKEVYRLTLQLSEFGDGKFRIEKTPNPPSDDFQGTPFNLNRWPKTKAKKGKDGIIQLVHDFSNADDLQVLLSQENNLSIDKDLGILAFAPKPRPNSDQQEAAVALYGKRMRLPLTLVFDIVENNAGRFIIQVSDPSRKFGVLECSILSGKDGGDPSKLIVSWNESIADGKKNTTDLFTWNGGKIDQPIERTFRLPVPNAKIDQVFALLMVKGYGRGATKVSRLEVRGRLSPMFGLGMGEKNGMVFTHNIIPKGLVEKAGIQVGDVILAINGKKPQTMQEAVDMLSRVSIGDEVVFSIQRADETKELRVVAE
ncbi:MAG: PDZ domain-containing protein [Planctomycetaceae bacterium]|nr:PDZ domain-containing protein [Planctomycetaceae bacterium]